MRYLAVISAALITGVVAVSPLRSQQRAVTSDSAIRAIIEERVNAKLSTGIVVGVLDPDGRPRVFAYGRSGTSRPLDANSVFEIGSIGKVLTTTLLADMVARSEVRLDDPVARYLPVSVKVPSRNGRQITLLDLATHSSGLPRSVATHRPKDVDDPLADLTPEAMYAFLSSLTLGRDPGAEFEYSNLGFMLLGDALARRAGAASVEELLRRRVLEPLGLRDTRATLTTSMRERLALGHDPDGTVVSNWHQHPMLMGDGGMRSTASDMLDFVAANMAVDLGDSREPLAVAIRTAHTRRRTGAPGQDIGLGWNRRALPSGDTIVSKNGGTRGYRTIVAYNAARRTGVVVLANSRMSMDDIAYHLAAPELPLRPPTLPSWVGLTEVKLPTAMIDRYVGEYALSPELNAVIRREGEGLVIEPGGRTPRPLFVGPPPRMRIFAEREDEFLIKDADARLSFQRDGSGRVTALVLRQGGREQVAKRIP